MYMSLDEAIEHCEGIAVEQDRKGCYSCAGEHRQLASWLRELKERREREECIR